MAGLCEGGNEPPGSLKASNVDEIDDSEMIFGEMRPRIRHRLHSHYGWGKPRKKPNQHFQAYCSSQFLFDIVEMKQVCNKIPLYVDAEERQAACLVLFSNIVAQSNLVR
ncbi:hypothetical protein ANN_22737 [Periplaneta americana]|uniref:Uncharacterized protein n=1 Tax=Periplaneta americana TaxID=6978 RepID=A0ABQ8SJ65_PERAM|nr:hypothetical protein ANN_22737 [Periplaneta americana]